MATVRQVSTNGGYITISFEWSDLTIGLLAFINVLETEKCPWTQTDISVTFDTDNNLYAFTAVVKR